nr:hypothetical protein [Pleurocapsa sp. FMAR1]
MSNLNTSDFYLPYNPLLVARAKELRRNPTPGREKIMAGVSKDI